MYNYLSMFIDNKMQVTFELLKISYIFRVYKNFVYFYFIFVYLCIIFVYKIISYFVFEFDSSQLELRGPVQRSNSFQFYKGKNEKLPSDLNCYNSCVYIYRHDKYVHNL